jgi:hypothetical protein
LWQKALHHIVQREVLEQRRLDSRDVREGQRLVVRNREDLDRLPLGHVVVDDVQPPGPLAEMYAVADQQLWCVFAGDLKRSDRPGGGIHQVHRARPDVPSPALERREKVAAGRQHTVPVAERGDVLLRRVSF